MPSVLHAAHAEARLLLWAEAAADPAAGSGPPSAVARGRRGAGGRGRAAGRGVAGGADAGPLPPPHPFAVAAPELRAVLAQTLPALAALAAGLQAVSVTAWLPTVPAGGGPPLPSPAAAAPPAPEPAPVLQAWTVPALALAPDAAAALLAVCASASAGALSLDVRAGADLAFWVGPYRLAAGLTARGALLPSVRRSGDGRFAAAWEPLLSGRERAALERLARAMPGACRALGAPGRGVPVTPAAAVVEAVVAALADHLPRAAAAVSPRRARPLAEQTLHDRWLDALGAPDGALAGPTAELEGLADAARDWAAPVAVRHDAAYRLCFRLEEPPPPEAEGDEFSAPAAPAAATGPWRVRYVLQAADDQSLLLEAEHVWAPTDRRFRIPAAARPVLLAALGRAAALVPEVDRSLQSGRPSGYALDTGGAHAFLTETAPLLEQAGFGLMLPAWWTGRGRGARLVARAHARAPKLAGSAGLGLGAVVEFDWTVALGDQTLTRAELERLAALKAPLVAVRGRWVQVGADEIQAALALWDGRGTRRGTLRDALRLAAGTAPGDLAALPAELGGAEGWIADLLARPDAAPFAELDPPEGLRATLRPYQVRGYSWLEFLTRHGLGACLADDMGLGKTVQTLALVARHWAEVQVAGAEGQPPRDGSGTAGSRGSEGEAAPDADGSGGGPWDTDGSAGGGTPASGARSAGARGADGRAFGSGMPAGGGLARGEAVAGPSGRRPVLLVCPTSVLGNWVKEAERFAPHLPLLMHHGGDRLRDEGFAASAAASAMVLTTYALLVRDLEALRAVPWRAVVLDEAQNVKNPETRQAQAARALTADSRIALTGTPVENSVGDLWALMEFLNPGLLGGQAEFRRRFFTPIQVDRDPEAAARLRRLTGPFVLRRLKTDPAIVADLPAKNEMKVYCTLTREQASLYAAVVADLDRRLEDEEEGAAAEGRGGIGRRGAILAALSKLKQVCNHPAQFLGDGSPVPGRSGKVERLVDMLAEALAAGDRALVFTQFAEMGALLQGHLRQALGCEVLFLHGGTARPAREAMVEAFQRPGGGPPVFLLSLKAGGTGLNLTAANRVFHFDRWWNPAVENQATDRAFRIGQRRDVQVHKFVCAGTLEERIDAMIETKRGIAEQVVGAGESWLTELSRADLRELLALRPEAVAD